DARRGNARGEREVAAQHRARIGLRHILVQVRRDPAPSPFGAIEETHLPERRRAPRRLSSGVVPDAYLPVVARSRTDGGSAVWSQDRRWRRHLTRGPMRRLAG